MRVILILIAVLLITFATAQKTCQPTSGISGSLCGNETHNAFVIPAKVCAYGPVDVSTTSCVQQVFNTWQLVCPKRNLQLTSFCQGWGGFENIDYTSPCWVLQECDNDDDCKVVETPVASGQASKKCFECCELCYDDCASRVGEEYADEGDNDCTPCPYTATPHSLPPIPVNSPSASGSSSGWTIRPLAITVIIMVNIVVFYINW